MHRTAVPRTPRHGGKLSPTPDGDGFLPPRGIPVLEMIRTDDGLHRVPVPLRRHDFPRKTALEARNVTDMQEQSAGQSQQIRSILVQHARLQVPVDQLGDDSDLYQAGLTSLATVNLMLALEEHFDVEFLDRMLGRKTFGSIRALEEAIAELRAGADREAA